ncbi:MAG: DUF1819 family protein [bacterium]|nr:DUF1819 family protein [Candidatus Limimorpha equi]
MPNLGPYSASLTACGLQFNEFNLMLPILLSDDRDALIKHEIENNDTLHINSHKSRQRVIAEYKRRVDAMPRDFWTWYLTLDEQAKRIALLYVILKTYRIAFDFHIKAVLRKWNSVVQTLAKPDLMMAFSEIAVNDAFVDSWTDNTKDTVAKSFLTILRQVGMLDLFNAQLKPLKAQPQAYAYYLNHGEDWFLEACLLQTYEIEQIKSALL